MQAYFALLHFALLNFTDIEFFTNRMFVATLHQASLSMLFFQQHLLFSCLCVTFWEFSQCFNLFYYYYICYGDLWPVIFDVTIVLVLGCCEPYPYKTMKWIHKFCVSSKCSTEQAVPPSFSLSSGFQIPWNTILKLAQLIMLQWALSVQVKGRLTGLLL